MIFKLRNLLGIYYKNILLDRKFMRIKHFYIKKLMLKKNLFHNSLIRVMIIQN